MGGFAGKKVAITGGSSGIGRAAAIELARRGASVAILARGREKLEATRAELEAAGTAKGQVFHHASVDVTDPAAVQAAADEILAVLGGLDLLICNSGYARCDTLLDQDLDRVRHLMDTNYFGHVNAVKAFLPHFTTQRSGSIQLVTSMLGFMSIYGYGAYSASKYAIAGLGEALRQEMVPFGVQVGVFYPPTTDTPGLEAENETKPAITWAIEGTSRKFTSEQVADALLRGIERGRFVNMVGLDSWFIYYATRLAPWLVRWITDGEMKKHLAKSGA